MILLIQPVSFGRRAFLSTAFAAAVAVVSPSLLFAVDNKAELEDWNKALSDLDSDFAKEVAMTSKLDFSKQWDKWVSFIKKSSVKNTKFAEGLVQRHDFPMTDENIKFAMDNPDTKYAAGIALGMPIRVDLIDFSMQDSVKDTIFIKNYTSREDFPEVLPLVEETVDYYINHPDSKFAIKLKENKGFKDGVNRIVEQKVLKQAGEWKDIKVTDITTDTFTQEVLNSKTPVLVDFWATWCGPCKTVAPRLQAIVNDYNDLLKVAKVDFDQNLNLTEKYNIQSVPTMILFKNGQPVEWVYGAQSKITIASKVEKHLD